MTNPTPLLPIFVKLESRACLVVGAGVIGLQKINSLLECGAHITVVAPEANDEIAALAAAGRVVWRKQNYRPEDLEHVSLAVAATNDPDVNHAVYRDATERGVLANAVDDPPFCDFYFSSVVRRGPLQIAISTAGESPALAQQIRKEVQAALPEDVGNWLTRLGKLRRLVLREQPAGEQRISLLKKLARRDICDSDSCPSRIMARAPRAPRVQTESWWLT
jgi:siroheme synthase-like protein